MSGQVRLNPSYMLTRVDDFAARVVARATPIRFGVAQSQVDLEAVYRLRYRVVVERGWARPESFPNSLERDIYDEIAVQIVAWDGDDIVAANRLVLPTAGYQLPTEEVFGLKIETPSRVADVSRTCRAPAYKDAKGRVFWGLLCQTWIELRNRGCTDICGIFTAAVIRMYRGLGFHVEILGGPRKHWGEERYPVLIRPTESVDSFRYG